MRHLFRLVSPLVLIATLACHSPEKKDARVGPPYLDIVVQSIARGAEGTRQVAVEVAIRNRLAKRDVFLKTNGIASALIRIRGRDAKVKEFVFSPSSADLLHLNDDRNYGAGGAFRYTFVSRLSDGEADPLEGSATADVDVQLVLESAAEYTDEKPYEIDAKVSDEKRALPIR